MSRAPKPKGNAPAAMPDSLDLSASDLSVERFGGALCMAADGMAALLLSDGSDPSDLEAEHVHAASIDIVQTIVRAANAMLCSPTGEIADARRLLAFADRLAAFSYIAADAIHDAGVFGEAQATGAIGLRPEAVQ